jgi:hypothetical protein
MRSSISDRETPTRADSGDSTWEVVDDGPLRWAADCVPFARTNTRLVQSSVLFYTLWSDDGSIGTAFLAVVTKSNIFLFESPKGERIFRFSKVSQFNYAAPVLLTLSVGILYPSSGAECHLCPSIR